MQVQRILLVLLVTAAAAERPSLYDDFSQRVTPYDFGYGVSVPATGDAKEHKESVSPSGHTTGEYRVLQPNGLYRVTRYRVNGGSGFRAKVTLEPGEHVTNYKYDRFDNPGATAAAARTSTGARRGHSTQDHFSTQQSTSAKHLQQTQGRRVSGFTSDKSRRVRIHGSAAADKTLSRDSHSRETYSRETNSREIPSSQSFQSIGSRRHHGQGIQRTHTQGLHGLQSFHSQQSHSSLKPLSQGSRTQGAHNRLSQRRKLHSQESHSNEVQRTRNHGSLRSQRPHSQTFQRLHNDYSPRFPPVPAVRRIQKSKSQVSLDSQRFHGRDSHATRSFPGQVSHESQRSRGQAIHNSQKSHGQVSHESQRSHNSQRLRGQKIHSSQRLHSQNSHGSQRSQNQALHSFQKSNSRESLRQGFHSFQRPHSQSIHRVASQASPGSQRPQISQGFHNSGLLSLQRTQNQRFQDSRESQAQTFQKSRSHSQGLSDSRLLERVQELGFIGSLNTRRQRVSPQKTHGQAVVIQRSQNQRTGTQGGQGQTFGFQRTESQRIKTQEPNRLFPIHTNENRRVSSQNTQSLRGDAPKVQGQRFGAQKAKSQTLGTHETQNRRFRTQRTQGQGFGVQTAGHRGFSTQKLVSQSDGIPRTQDQRIYTSPHFLGASQIRNKNVIQNIQTRDFSDSDESHSSPESSSQQSEDDDFSYNLSTNEEASIEGFQDEEIRLKLQEGAQDFTDGNISIQKFKGKHFGTRQFVGDDQVSQQLQDEDVNIQQDHSQGFGAHQFGDENNSNQQDTDENISTRQFQGDDVTIQQFQQQEFGPRQLTNLKAASPKSPSGFNIQQHHDQSFSTQQASQFHQFQSQQFGANQLQDQQLPQSHHQDLRVQQSTGHPGVSTTTGLGHQVSAGARPFEHPGGQGSTNPSVVSHRPHGDHFTGNAHDGEQNIGVSLFDVQNFPSSPLIPSTLSVVLD